jgi:hypothetical protein
MSEPAEIAAGLGEFEKRLLLECSYPNQILASEVWAAGQLEAQGLVTLTDSFQGPEAKWTDLGHQVAKVLEDGRERV